MRTRRHRARALMAAALALGLGACSNTAGPGPSALTELPRELSVNERAVIGASNSFGWDLAARVFAADPRPNVVLSPLSASMALGMTLNGAEGATFEAIRTALGFSGMTREAINAAYRDLIDLLEDLDPQVRFEIANAIWANEGVPFHQAFFQAVQAAFDASAESRDFADPATLTAINDWVEDNTGGLIDSIVDQLDPDLVMLLVNAIYFDGAWTTQFDSSDTREQAFTRPDGSTVQVDMMTMDDPEILAGGGADYAAVELPYGGQAFSMVVVLPQGAGSARDFAAALDADAWDAIVEGLGPGNIAQLGLPKFTLTYDTYLNDALQAMGMGVAFGPGADFTAMSPIGDELCISFVRQKTFIEVDERGTRAAAVTAVGISVTSLPPSFIADRPFLFAIRERLTGTILFVGLVEDPTADDPGPEPATSQCG
ncbi:MAG: serpin family protein [Gemmatimonadota bacterium]